MAVKVFNVVIVFSWMRLQWLCCGEVVSCVVVGDRYSVALEGDNYTIYCLPHCRPSVTFPAFSLLSATELQCHLSCLSWHLMSSILISSRSVIWSEGEQAQSGVSSCLDPPRTSEGFLTAPPSGEVTPTTPAQHEQALVSLETAISQQVHQPITELLLADSNPDSHGALAGAGLPQLSAPDRPNCEAEASQMEMSPAPTIGERGGGGGALDAVREGRLTLNPVKNRFYTLWFSGVTFTSQ